MGLGIARHDHAVERRGDSRQGQLPSGQSQRGLCGLKLALRDAMLCLDCFQRCLGNDLVFGKRFVLAQLSGPLGQGRSSRGAIRLCFLDAPKRGRIIKTGQHLPRPYAVPHVHMYSVDASR